MRSTHDKLKRWTERRAKLPNKIVVWTTFTGLELFIIRYANQWFSIVVCIHNKTRLMLSAYCRASFEMYRSVWCWCIGLAGPGWDGNIWLVGLDGWTIVIPSYGDTVQRVDRYDKREIRCRTPYRIGIESWNGPFLCHRPKSHAEGSWGAHIAQGMG